MKPASHKWRTMRRPRKPVPPNTVARREGMPQGFPPAPTTRSYAKPSMKPRLTSARSPLVALVHRSGRSFWRFFALGAVFVTIRSSDSMNDSCRLAAEGNRIRTPGPTFEGARCFTAEKAGGLFPVTPKRAIPFREKRLEPLLASTESRGNLPIRLRTVDVIRCASLHKSPPALSYAIIGARLGDRGSHNDTKGRFSGFMRV